MDGDSGTPTEAVGLSLCKSTTNHRSKLKKKNFRKKKVENRMHKVLIIGDSHARGCASEVKQKLNGDYEVIGFTNPGSTMKEVKESAKVKIAQLTKEDTVVLWGGSNDVAKNNSVVGMKHMLDLVINSTRTNVILLSVPHRHDLIKESCVNREVEVFNRNLKKQTEVLQEGRTDRSS